MYIERDAKIILIYESLIGIATFTGLLFAVIFSQQQNPEKNFTGLLILLFGIIIVLTLICIASMISLKREISRQKEYLENRMLQTSSANEQYAKVPYDKSGLYFNIGVCIFLLIFTLYLFASIIFYQPSNAHVPQSAVTIVSIIFFIIVLILFITLFASLYILFKRIHTPLYYEVKICPRCRSNDVHRVDYSWWGGFLGPRLVHQVRCKKCGKTYNGATGTDITRNITIYMMIAIIIFIIISLIDYFY